MKEIKAFLKATVEDPIPLFLFESEIEHKTILNNDLSDSKWYKELKKDQQSDGSFGRFHSMDTKEPIKRRFNTTEKAVRRIKDLCIPNDDELVRKTTSIMIKYLTNEEKWSDTIEHHYGFEVALNSMVAANLSYLNYKHPLVEERKKLCAYYIKESFKDGLDINIWTKLNNENYNFFLMPETLHIISLLYDNLYIEENTLRQYMNHIFNLEKGIYYLQDFPPLQLIPLESKYFFTWINTLEHLSNLSLFKEYTEHIKKHLIKETHRLINNDFFPQYTTPILGHYHESWRINNHKVIDLVLRLARLIEKS